MKLQSIRGISLGLVMLLGLSPLNPTLLRAAALEQVALGEATTEQLVARKGGGGKKNRGSTRRNGKRGRTGFSRHGGTYRYTPSRSGAARTLRRTGFPSYNQVNRQRRRAYRRARNTWNRYDRRGWWAGRNWARSRPWRAGWYGNRSWNRWNWWPGQSAAWGLAGLATFGTITSLINAAQSNQTRYIEVPDSDYSLYYPSVQSNGSGVSFEADDGENTVSFNADCESGRINGMAPQSSEQAQLLNAACQVAFGQ